MPKSQAPSAFDNFIFSAPWKPTSRKADALRNPRSLNRKTCWRCRRAKTKCSGEYPCHSCILKGFSSSCAPNFEDSPANRGTLNEDFVASVITTVGQSARAPVDMVERPFKFRTTEIEMFEIARTPSVKCFGPMSVQDELAWQFSQMAGFSKSAIKKMTFGMPEELCQSVLSAFKISQHAVCTSASMLAGPLSDNPDQGTLADSDPALKAKPSFPLDPKEAYLFAILDCTTWQPCKLALNQRFAHMAGSHTEEMLSRMAHGEMNILSSELDALCAYISGVNWAASNLINAMLDHKRGNPVHIPQERITYEVATIGFQSSSDPRSVLIKCRTKMQLLTGGRYARMEMFATAIAPEDYDAALTESPENCRKLQSEIGDRRSGQDLISGDYLRSTLKDMATGSEGSSILSSLNNEVLRQNAEMENLIHQLGNQLGSLSLNSPSPAVNSPPEAAAHEAQASMDRVGPELSTSDSDHLGGCNSVEGCGVEADFPILDDSMVPDGDWTCGLELGETEDLLGSASDLAGTTEDADLVRESEQWMSVMVTGDSNLSSLAPEAPQGEHRQEEAAQNEQQQQSNSTESTSHLPVEIQKEVEESFEADQAAGTETEEPFLSLSFPDFGDGGDCRDELNALLDSTEPLKPAAPA